jgi:hypothetical protein
MHRARYAPWPILITLLLLASTIPVEAKGRPPRLDPPTPTPAPLPTLDGGRIYAQHDLPPLFSSEGDVMSVLDPDGSNETTVSAMAEFPAYGKPSTALHDGLRWFVRWEPRDPRVFLPDGGEVFDLVAYREGSAAGIQLTDNAAAGIRYNHPYGTVHWTASPTTGEPDGALVFAGLKWVDDDGDGALDRIDMDRSGIFLAELAFDGAGGLALVAQPTSAVVTGLGGSSGSSLQIFDFAIAPDASRVAYATQTRRLMVADVPSSDPATHVEAWDWSGDVVDWSVGSPGRLALPGCEVTKYKGRTRVLGACGIFTMDPDGDNPVLVARRKGATAEDPLYTWLDRPRWSPAGTHVIYFERVREELGTYDTDVAYNLRRATGDGRDDVSLASEHIGIDWVSAVNVAH